MATSLRVVLGVGETAVFHLSASIYLLLINVLSRRNRLRLDMSSVQKLLMNMQKLLLHMQKLLMAVQKLSGVRTKAPFAYAKALNEHAKACFAYAKALNGHAKNLWYTYKSSFCICKSARSTCVSS